MVMVMIMVMKMLMKLLEIMNLEKIRKKDLVTMPVIIFLSLFPMSNPQLK